MKIAVLGSGNGGCAVAFDCAAHGHTVSLFDFERFPDTVAAVRCVFDGLNRLAGRLLLRSFAEFRDQFRGVFQR